MAVPKVVTEEGMETSTHPTHRVQKAGIQRFDDDEPRKSAKDPESAPSEESQQECDDFLGKEDSQNDFMRSSIAAQEEVSEIFQRSKLFTKRKECRYWSQLPRFESEEIERGDTLGTGAFCSVKEITRVLLKDHCKGNKSDARVNDDDKSVDVAAEGRKFISKHCIRENIVCSVKGTSNHTRYAIKAIKDSSLASSETFFVAAIDLAIEAHFLSVIEHPNIIKLRGLALAKPATRNFFLVLDRLYDNLQERIEKWKKKEVRRKKLLRKLINHGSREEKEKRFFDERLTVSADLADALNHLHSRNILHRDLKPDNIGFDVRDDVKIFDFGLAKEIHPEHALIDGTYMLSGETGTVRYMAPEVFLNQPYNKAVDIYSLALVLWGILSLDTPFRSYDLTMMRNLVFGRGFRPNMDKSWPDTLQKLICSSWAQSFQERPSAGIVAEGLKVEILNLRGGNKSNSRGLDHSTRRSTFFSPLTKFSSRRLIPRRGSQEGRNEISESSLQVNSSPRIFQKAA